MTLRLNTTARDERVEHFASLFDGGILDIYTGAQPLSSDDAASGTLLVSVNLPTPAFSGATSGTVVKDGTWSGTAVADGDAGWARMRDASDLVRLDGSVGLTGTDSDFLLDNISVVDGAVVTIVSASLTEPASEE